MKTKLLSLLLILSLVLSGNCLELDAASTKTFSIENYAVIMNEGETTETIDIPEDVEWDDLQLYQDIYDEVDYSRFWHGPEEAPVIEVKEPPKDIYMGEFKITYYCPCYECSEGHGHNTATGKRATEGRTIAVDPRVIPYGTRVLINGHEYVAEDCGGMIKQQKIDIFLEDHAETERRGIDWFDVWIVRS